jgi:hypothetical protein
MKSCFMAAYKCVYISLPLFLKLLLSLEIDRVHKKYKVRGEVVTRRLRLFLECLFHNGHISLLLLCMCWLL